MNIRDLAKEIVYKIGTELPDSKEYQKDIQTVEILLSSHSSDLRKKIKRMPFYEVKEIDDLENNTLVQYLKRSDVLALLQEEEGK